MEFKHHQKQLPLMHSLLINTLMDIQSLTFRVSGVGQRGLENSVSDVVGTTVLDIRDYVHVNGNVNGSSGSVSTT